MNEKVKAALFVKPGKFIIQEFEKPSLGPYDILMKIRLCGICGSDIHFWNGVQGLSTPYIMGHEFIGEVTEVGTKAIQQRRINIDDQITVEILIPCHQCRWCKQGRYNICQKDDASFTGGYGRQYGCNIPASRLPTPLWGGFAQYLYVPQEAFVHKYEKKMEWKTGVLTEPLATALHAVNVAKLGTGESCVILGPGTIGLCAVVAAKNAGAYPIILIGAGEKDENRLVVGQELGADYTINSSQVENLIDKVREVVDDFGADMSIEASGSPEAQLLAMKMVKRGGRCVFVGINGRKALTLIPDTDLVFREVNLSGCILSAQGYEGAVKILESSQFPLSKVVTHEFPLERINQAFHFVNSRLDNVIKVVINPWSQS